MSLYATPSTASEWPSYRFQPNHSIGLPRGRQGGAGLGLGYGRIQPSTIDTRPVLRSHKSFPYSLSTSLATTGWYQSPLSQVANPNNSYLQDHRETSQEDRDSTPSVVEKTYGHSAPTSPASHVSPPPTGLEPDDAFDDDDDALMEEDGEQAVDTGPPKTAAERRADKRKMKRFRLTHNQTRFLMSEFSRQAHPDAAQRERLSREIPGLTPRQVQVWFQNRRAKLKRLTTEDRERMMKSRALPDDFDIAQTLHTPFGIIPQSYSTPMASPASYATTFADNGSLRPLMLDGLRRQSEDDSIISPISITSNYSGFYTPPASIAASETMSPISPIERSTFANLQLAQATSPRRTNPFMRSSSFSSNIHSTPSHVSRLQLHERVSRTRAESLASPLRSSMSYTGNALNYGSGYGSSQEPTSVSLSQATFSPWEPPKGSALDVSYNSGMSTGTHSQGFQSSILARTRPSNTTFPPGLDLRPQSRPLVPFSAFQHLHNPHSLQSGPLTAPLTAPQDFHLPSSRDTGFSFTRTTTATYDVPFPGEAPDPFPALNQDTLHDRIIEEVNEDIGSFPESSLDADGNDGEIEEVEMCQDGEPEKTNGLQRPVPYTRQRSFTLPSHLGTSQV